MTDKLDDIPRYSVKRAIKTSVSDDKELTVSLSEAKKIDLEITKENNRHAKDMLGWVGRIFGHEHCAPIYIAFTLAAIGLISAFGCYYFAYIDANNVSFWSDQSTKLITFSSVAVGYIFGKGSNSEKK